MCELIRADAKGRSNELTIGTLKPLSAADTNSSYRKDGKCANERGSSAHKRISAANTKGACPPSLAISEATSERDVSGPFPKLATIPNTRGIPLDLAVTEWGRCLRDEYVPSRKRYKPSAVDSGAAMAQRKGDSFPCMIPGTVHRKRHSVCL